MRSQILLLCGALALAAPGAVGCAGVPASTMTFENTIVPVSIGPVQRMGGVAIEDEAEPQTTRTVEATNLYRYNSNGSGGGSITRQTEGPGKFDIEADRALEDCPKCRVQLDGVRVGSHSAVLIGLSDDTHWTGANMMLFREASRRK